MEIKTPDGQYIYTIDFSPVRYYRDLYKCMNQGFEVPPYVGDNLDALWDVLTGFIGWPCEIQLSGLASLSKQRRQEATDILKVLDDAEKEFPDDVHIVYVD